MLHYAVVFFVIALVAAVFGFTGIAPVPRDRQDPLLRLPDRRRHPFLLNVTRRV